METDRQFGAPRSETSEPLALRADDESTSETMPRRDLFSAVVVALFAVIVMVYSADLERPDQLFTAPALLPFVIALALLIMAVALGWGAVRDGAARGFFTGVAAAVRDHGISMDDWRAALLAVIVLAYVLLVAAINLELRFSTANFDFIFSGYELVSIVVITTVLRVFWRAGSGRCFLVALISVEVLAWAFRYGFNIPMPEAF